MATNHAGQVMAHLASKGFIPTETWLTSFLSTQKTTTPLPALKQTALFRILASNITETLAPSTESTFPSDVLNADIRERRLIGPIPVQVLDVQDIGRSKWSQIEAIEAAEKGETTKGREVIRVVPDEDGLSDANVHSKGPFKLLLQDQRGTSVYGMEIIDISGVDMNMNIGAKMILRNAKVARGVVILEPETASLVGGKIDQYHKRWKGELKSNLKSSIEAPSDT